MKKVVMLYVIGMLCSILGAAETQVFNADFKKQSFDWAQFHNTKVRKGSAFTTEIIAPAPAGKKVGENSIQIGVFTPNGWTAGSYRMEASIAVNRDAQLPVSLIMHVPPYTKLGFKTVDFKENVTQKVSIPFEIKKAGDYPIRTCSMYLGKLPVGTKVTIGSVKIFQITK